MKLHDSHIHIGQFRELYSSPQDVLDFMTKLGVDKFAVSSTSTTAFEWDFVLKEIKQIIDLGGTRVIPVLWINPEWVQDGTLDKMLQSGITWKCLKIHGYFSHWEDTPELLQEVVDLAGTMEVPLLLHTGGREESDAGSYLDIIDRNPKVKFILAHSRPVEQAIEVMKACENAWADTAFTPVDAIEEMVKAGLSNRMLWGTDYPLHHVFYEGKDIYQLIQGKLEAVKTFTTIEQFENITYKNFEKIFAIYS